MTPQERKKLEMLLRTLDEGRTLVREILQQGSGGGEQEPPSDFDAHACLQSLKSLDRASAEKQLSEMKQHELGAVFVQSGGASTDRKKPKVWLIEQILWRVFDFERGHDAIRSKGAGEGRT
jgi:hypothetical protein